MVWYEFILELTSIATHLNYGRHSSHVVSGGFAIVHPNNSLTINAVEAAPLEDFSPEVCCLPLELLFVSQWTNAMMFAFQAIRQSLAEAQKATSTGSEEARVEARVEVEVYEALQYALSK